MHRLALNYMRPVAMLLLFLLSVGILSSFIFIPKNLVYALPDYYHHYWQLLSILLMITVVFLGMAFYAERKSNANWLHHTIALTLIVWFIKETYTLINIGGILFAFIN